MLTSVVITVKYGTMSQASTTWADTKVTEITRRNTTSNEQDDVGGNSCLHINIHFWLLSSNLITSHNLQQHFISNSRSVNISVKRPKTKTAYWSKIRKKAPKVPDITCPAIDSVLNRLEKQVDRALTIKQFKTIERKLEKLRIANEKLRESGIYWHDACKETVRDLLGKKKMR